MQEALVAAVNGKKVRYRYWPENAWMTFSVERKSFVNQKGRILSNFVDGEYEDFLGNRMSFQEALKYWEKGSAIRSVRSGAYYPGKSEDGEVMMCGEYVAFLDILNQWVVE